MKLYFKKAGWLAIMLCLFHTAYSQTKLDWSVAFNKYISGSKMQLDNTGNILIAGQSMYSSTGWDFQIVKYNSVNGDTIWTARYSSDSIRNDAISQFALDKAGNVYVTGNTQHDSTYSTSVVTMKYNANGKLLWKDVSIKGLHYDTAYEATSLVIDTAGNTYVAGIVLSKFIKDVEGTAKHPSHYADFIAKYDQNGIKQWMKMENSTTEYLNRNDLFYYRGDVYSFRPSYDTTNQTYPYIYSKYNQQGNETLISNTMKGCGLMDTNGNLYGVSDNIYMYNVGGKLQWEYPFTVPYAKAITLDNSGNIFLTGGATAYYQIQSAKYNATGKLWNQQYVTNTYDFANAIAVDNLGNVYVAGQTEPAPSTTYHYVVLKYNASGILMGELKYAGVTDADYLPSAIQCDKSGNVYIMGSSQKNTDQIITRKYSYIGLGIDNSFSLQNNIKVGPNPTNSVVAITFDNSLYQHFSIMLFNYLGQQVPVQYDYMATGIQLYQGMIPPGIYMLELLDNNKKLCIQKLVFAE